MTAPNEDSTHIAEDVVNLLEAIERKFPTTIGDDQWYLCAIAALTGGGRPEVAASVYLYLIEQPQYSAPDSRKGLIQRIRETLVKCVALIGVCRPLEAIFSITDVQRPEDRDFTFSRENWKPGPENLSRAMAWENRIYLHNIDVYDNQLVAHKDFAWIGSEIVYGLFLSDHTILNDVETELVVLTAIMIQNLHRETHWHLRGLRRMNVSLVDVESIHQCVELIAEFVGVKIDKVPRVKDIEHEV